MNDTTSRLIIATALGSIVASLLVVILTIVGEEWAPLKNWLKAKFSHHWLGKSYLSVIFFILTSLVGYPFTKNIRVSNAVWCAFTVALISSLTLCLYFILHVLHMV